MPRRKLEALALWRLHKKPKAYSGPSLNDTNSLLQAQSWNPTLLHITSAAPKAPTINFTECALHAYDYLKVSCLWLQRIVNLKGQVFL